MAARRLRPRELELRTWQTQGVDGKDGLLILSHLSNYILLLINLCVLSFRTREVNAVLEVFQLVGLDGPLRRRLFFSFGFTNSSSNSLLLQFLSQQLVRRCQEACSFGANRRSHASQFCALRMLHILPLSLRWTETPVGRTYQAVGTQ